MNTSAGLLASTADSMLCDEIDRIAAAVGVRAVHLPPPPTVGRTTWSAAVAVVLDADTARWCAQAGLPRRPAVFVVAAAPPDTDAYQAALSIGARAVLTLPDSAGELVEALSANLDGARAAAGTGEVLAVIGGKGGAGASLFAAAVAQRASGALLVDLDRCGGGIDLLLGAERATGLRWPDLSVKHGRISWAALRAALPEHRGVTVLSATRAGAELEVGAVDSVIEAGRGGGALVVCDLARQRSAAVDTALDAADLVVVVCPSDVRSCAATSALVPALTAVNPNVGVVVRGPSPGGLRAGEVAEIIGLPLIAAMRPEPLLAERLERDGLRLRARSPLTNAADRVLATMVRRPGSRPAEPAA